MIPSCRTVPSDDSKLRFRNKRSLQTLCAPPARYMLGVSWKRAGVCLGTCELTLLLRRLHDPHVFHQNEEDAEEEEGERQIRHGDCDTLCVIAMHPSLVGGFRGAAGD